MKIALDGTPLTVSTGGIARYTSELSRALAREFPGDEISFISDRLMPEDTGAPRNLRRQPAGGAFFRKRWWSIGVTRALQSLGCEVFHGTDFAVPYLPATPSVMTLHDLSPWRGQGWHAGAGRVARRTPYLLKLGLATMVITPTEAIRREAIEFFGLSPAMVTAVPLAAADHFRPVESPVPRKPYFLYVGVLEPRKNLGLIMEAWSRIRRDHDVELVLAGRRREDMPPVPGIDGLRLAGEAPDQLLPALYSRATAFLYPSLYEGFGLPVLEAMCCGAAVITSRDPAITEVAGNAALALDAADVAQWTDAMRSAITNPPWLRELRAAALRRGREFSWRESARMTREVYVEAIERFGH